MGRKKKVVDLEEYKRELKSESAAKASEGHYVPNAILLEELKRCQEKGEISDDLARMFTAIATKLSNRNIYKYPEDKEDCISKAVMDCVNYWKGFNTEKGDNPFAYFTTVCTNGLAKGWKELGYKDMPFSKRVYITENIFSI